MRGVGAVDHVGGVDVGWRIPDRSAETAARSRSARSAPAMPGYCASNALPSFSPTGKIHRGIQNHLGFFFRGFDQLRRDRLRRRRCGAGGGREHSAKRKRARAFQNLASGKLWLSHGADPFAPNLSAERPAAFDRQSEPDFGASGNGGFGRCNDAQHRAVRCFDHVVAVGAEKHLARHGGLDGILGCCRG